MTAAATPTPLWRGWIRPHKLAPWEAIAEGASYEEALTSLLDALASQRGGESIVLPAARHPDGTTGRGQD
jgi:hypothetical protein